MALPSVDLDHEPAPGPLPGADRLLAVIRLQHALATMSPDSESVAQFVAQRAMAMTGGSGAAVILCEDGALRRAGAAGRLAPSRGSQPSVTGSLVGRCVAEARPLHAPDTRVDDRVDRLACRRVRAGAVLCVPCFEGGRVIGAVEVIAERARHFDAADCTTLVLLADTIAGALAQARRLREARRAGARDPLTGLGDRDAFDAALAREVERHRRYQAPLSMTLVDLDRLRALNEAHGRAAGDDALRDVAAIILLELRTCDDAFRLGDDDLAILWPDTPLAGAAVATARVATHLDGAGIGRGLVRVSVGVAEARGDEAPYLFARATAALALDKHRRR